MGEKDQENLFINFFFFFFFFERESQQPMIPDVWAQVIIGCEREPTTYDTDVRAQVIIGCDPDG